MTDFPHDPNDPHREEPLPDDSPSYEDTDSLPPQSLESAPKEAAEEAPGTPWDHRSEIGLVEALVESTRLLLFHPGQFFKQLSPQGGFGGPLLYFLLFSIALTLFAFPATYISELLKQKLTQTALPQYVKFLETYGQTPPAMRNFLELALENQPGAISIFTSTLCCSLFLPVIAVIALFITSAIYSVFGLFFGGKVDYEMIFRVMAFAEVAKATYIINPIPFLREFIFFFHWLVMLVIGFREVGELSTGKAVLLALLPILLFMTLGFCCLCGFPVIFGFMVSIV